MPSAAAHPAGLLLAVSILCTSSLAIGDDRVERAHQLSGELQASLRDGDSARAAILAEEIVQLERQAAEIDVLRLAESLGRLGQIRASIPDLDGAEAAFVEAQGLYSERLGPLNPFSGFMIGGLSAVYSARGDRTKAALAMDRVVSMVPPVDARSAVFCAGVYQAAGEWEKARSMLELAARLDPNDTAVMNDLAYALLSSPRSRLADFQRAAQLAQSSFAARPDSIAVADTLVLALVRVGRDADAQKVLEKLLEAPLESVGESRAEVEFHAALAMERSGDPVRAAALAQSAIDGAVPGVFDPGPAKDLLARLTSRLPEHSGRLDDAH